MRPAAQALLLLAAALPLAAAEGDRPDGEQPLLYILVKVPKSAIGPVSNQINGGGNSYFPIKHERLDRILQTIHKDRAEASPARLQAARYSARLDGDTLVDGQARWTIQHHGTQQSFLPVAPCRLAAGTPQWQDDPPRPAQLGTDASGGAALLVPRSGELMFPWSLRGQGDEASVQFDLQLPPCMFNQLQLDLPAPMAPQLFVSRSSGGKQALGIVSQAPRSEWPANLRRWQMELGSVSQATLVISSAAAAPLPGLVQSNVFRLTPSGLELQTDLRLTTRSPLDHVQLLLSPELRLVSARLGDTQLVVDQLGESRERVMVRLPRSVRDSPAALRVTAYARLEHDVLWTLPQVAVENAVWKEGESVLVAADTLQLRHLHLHGCRQTIRQVQPSGAEEIHLRHDSPDATVRVDVQVRRSELSAVSGVSARWAGDQLVARTVCDVQSQWGERFVLRLHIPKGWEVDSIATAPGGALDDERLVLAPTNQVLEAPLRRPVAPGSPLRVILQAHRRAPANDTPLGGDELLVGRLLEASAGQTFLSVQGDIQGDKDLRRVDPRLTPASNVVDSLPGGAAFEVGPGLSRLRVTAPPQRQEFTADIRVEAEVRDDLFEERFVVRCVPKSRPISQVRIQVIPPTGPLAWRLSGSAAGLSVQQQEPADGGTRQLWELTLSRPQQEMFVLEATRSRPVDSQQQVSLVSLPESLSQTGVVVVSSQTVPIRVAGESLLEPLSAPATPAGQFGLVRAMYRYEPSAPEPPRIVTDAAQGRLAWAWSQQLRTRLSVSGTGSHEALFRMENLGADTVTLRPPDGAVVLQVEVDGEPQDTQLVDGRLKVPLPAARRYPALRVSYTTRQLRLDRQLSCPVEAPLVRLNVPVLQSRWTMLAPPGYRSLQSGGTWSARLLGPLAGIFARSTEPAASARGAARSALEELHAELAPTTWGQLLRAYQGRSDEGLAPPMLVHAAALAEQQIWPATRLAAPGSDRSPAELAGHLLEWSNLSLWPAEGRTVVLSSVGGDLSAVELVTAEAWASTPTAGMSWQEPPARPYQLRQDANWTCVQRALTGDETQTGSAETLLYNYMRAQSMAWAALIVAAGVAAWLPWRGLVSAAVVALAAVMLWGTPLWALSGAAALWGLLLGRFCRIAWPAARRAAATAGPPAAAAAAALLAVHLTAQEDPPKPKLVLHRVLVPVDEEGNPTGEYAFVPMKFWTTIEKMEQAALTRPQGWLLLSAEYDARLGAAGESRLPITAKLRMQAYQADTTIALPFSRDHVVQVTVDGAATPYTWDPDNGELRFKAPEPRVYDVQVQLTPAIETSAAGSSLTTAIPAALQSRLTIGLPDSQHQVSVVSAQGQVSDDEISRQLLAELGPVGQLQLRWESPRDPDFQQLRVEERTWLRVAPDSVVLDGLFRFRSPAPARRLWLLADRRLRLLSLQCDGRDEVPVQVQEHSAGQVYELALEPPLEDELVVRASFHLTDSSGIGVLQVPRLDALADELTSRTFGITVRGALVSSEILGTDLEPLAPDEFAAAWGGDERPAQAVRRSTRHAADDLQVAVRYSPLESEAVQSCDVVAQRDALELDYKATVSGLKGLQFRHELRVPVGLQLRSVRVEHDGRDITRSFFLDRAGNLTLFLKAPAGDEHQISVEGRLPGDASSRPLPMIEMRSAVVHSHQIRVFRHDDLESVSLQDVSGLRVDRQAAGSFQAGRGRLVAQLTPDAADWSATLKSVVNSGQPTAVMLTRLSRNEGQWVAHVDGRVSLEGGVVDLLRLEIPDEWSEPFELAVDPSADRGPPTRLEVSALPGLAGRRLLTLIPGEAIRDSFDFSIRAPLAATAADGVRRAPDIVLKDMQVQRFVALPQQAGGQQFDWIVQGLQAVPLLPPPLSQRLADDPTAQAYEVFDRQYEATVQGVERVSGLPPLVRLADIHVAWQPGSCQGVAAFELEPAGLTHCDLELPEHCELIEVTVADVRASRAPLGPRKWRISLGPDQLPQRIVAVYRGRLAAGSPSAVLLEAPQVSGVETVRTLWTVYGPPEAGGGRPLPAEYVDTAQRHEVFRLETLANLVELASDVAAESATDEVANWYAPWSRQLANSQRKLEAMRLEADVRQRVESFLAGQDDVAARIRMEESRRRYREDPRGTATAADVWRLAQRPDSQPTYCTYQGAAPEIELTYQPRQRPAYLPPLLLGLVVLAVAAAHTGTVGDWLMQWPYLTGVLAGLAAAIWLPWPWIGWLVVALSMLASLRR